MNPTNFIFVPYLPKKVTPSTREERPEKRMRIDPALCTNRPTSHSNTLDGRVSPASDDQSHTQMTHKIASPVLGIPLQIDLTQDFATSSVNQTSTSSLNGPANLPLYVETPPEKNLTLDDIMSSGCLNSSTINKLLPNGDTALMALVKLKDLETSYKCECIARLLTLGANPDIADSQGVTPLQLSLQSGWTEVSRLLLATKPSNPTQYLFLCLNAHNMQFLKFLAHYNADLAGLNEGRNLLASLLNAELPAEVRLAVFKELLNIGVPPFVTNTSASDHYAKNKHILGYLTQFDKLAPEIFFYFLGFLKNILLNIDPFHLDAASRFCLLCLEHPQPDLMEVACDLLKKNKNLFQDFSSRIFTTLLTQQYELPRESEWSVSIRGKSIWKDLLLNKILAIKFDDDPLVRFNINEKGYLDKTPLSLLISCTTISPEEKEWLIGTLLLGGADPKDTRNKSAIDLAPLEIKECIEKFQKFHPTHHPLFSKIISTQAVNASQSSTAYSSPVPAPSNQASQASSNADNTPN